MDLQDRVIHLLEGEDVIESQCESCVSVPKTEHPHFVEWHVRPIDELIRRGTNGRLMALDCIALILFAVRESFAVDAEREIVEAWGAELRAAVASGEVVARHSVTWLPLRELPASWDWMLAIEDADAFVKARGMGWTCTDRIEHIAREISPADEARRPVASPGESSLPDLTPEPTEPATGGSARARHDDIQIEIDDARAGLEQGGENVTPAKVMAKLKARAGRPDSCISEPAPDGVLWTRGSSGEPEKLTVEALKKRISRRAKGTRKGR